MTRLELLIAILIVLFLGTIAVVGWNVSKQTPQERNAQRQQDVSLLLDAVYQYALDHREQFPVTIPEESQEICRTEATNCTGLLDFSAIVPYILKGHLPIDPFATNENSTEYRASKTRNGAIRISAPNAEMGEEIFVER